MNLKSAGLTISASISVGSGNVRLISSDGISQTGTITAAGLSLQNSTAGNITLSSANAISTLAASNTFEAVTFNDGTNALAVGTVATASAGEDPSGLFAAVSGITSSAGGVTLTSGTLTLGAAQTISAPNAPITATVSGTSGTVLSLASTSSISAGTTVNGSITLQDLSTTGTGVFSIGGTLTAGNSLQPGASVTINNQGPTANEVAFLAGTTLAGTGIQLQAGNATSLGTSNVANATFEGASGAGASPGYFYIYQGGAIVDATTIPTASQFGNSAAPPLEYLLECLGSSVTVSTASKFTSNVELSLNAATTVTMAQI